MNEKEVKSYRITVHSTPDEIARNGVRRFCMSGTYVQAFDAAVALCQMTGHDTGLEVKGNDDWAVCGTVRRAVWVQYHDGASQIILDVGEED